MTDELSQIADLWNSQWTAAPADVAPILGDRFTAEAYRQIAAAVPCHDATVLEAGCGTGRFSALLGSAHPNAEVVGIDVSVAALKTATRIATTLGCRNVRFREASIFELPFPDDSFDYVFNEGVIPLFSERSSHTHEDAVREMCRVAKPGGVVLVSVANWYCLPHTAYKWCVNTLGRGYELGYEKSFRHEELRKLLRANGLHDIRFSGFYPSYGLYRLSRKPLGSLRPVLHRLGTIVDRIERPWLSRRFGFQLVATARK